MSGKYRKIHKLRNITQKKPTRQNTAKQNYPGSIAFYNTRPGNEVGLFYNARELTQGQKHIMANCTTCCLTYNWQSTFSP